ncbi:transcriptional regulator with XRE-family HTH domain [Lysinibacillus composti]|uniref:XRE family transcriptional regulator n=1 Tax=Lysinibacillus composti TaxID=720633 RepID=A0A3N9UEG9_9BACI|nr:XRE family transcriptional regulator [Lysinibacillus composti]MBM7608695.1 transcriptional regulator with XRE-family HTH domain [Lysinibacillus composti]RQW74608.1 XRE family transcriptional regulator [Lysinibacillus composti]
MTIGEQLRSIRKNHKMTLKTLSEKTGVSISFLSQVERNKCNVTLESLRKISDALNVNPSVFFPQNQEDDSNKLYPFIYEDLSNQITGASFHPILVTLKPKENIGKEFSHYGHEFIYVLSGILTISLEGKTFELNETESYMFDSSRNHYWWNNSDEDVHFLLVSTL